MTVNQLTIKLDIKTYLKPRIAEKIRGYFGNIYKEDSLFHQHSGDGKVIYRYPMIQYKIIEGIPHIIGIGYGAKALRKKFMELNTLLVEDKSYEVFQKIMTMEESLLCIASHQISYRFLSPWYALNQKNYRKYCDQAAPADRKALLRRVLTGNLLSINKSLNKRVSDEIIVGDLKVSECNFALDDVPLIGFTGDFTVNFHVPDYLGLGKAVSRGFGTILRMEDKQA